MELLYIFYALFVPIKLFFQFMYMTLEQTLAGFLIDKHVLKYSLLMGTSSCNVATHAHTKLSQPFQK